LHLFLAPLAGFLVSVSVAWTLLYRPQWTMQVVLGVWFLAAAIIVAVLV
jgi:hypothetical protein